ncbi:MAG: hypothetical protein WA459_17630 [Stellaceae bacterium]
MTLEFLSAQIERVFAELRTIRDDQVAMRDDIKVLTTIVLRHDKTLTGSLTQIRAMVSQHSRFNDRLRRLEEQPAE